MTVTHEFEVQAKCPVDGSGGEAVNTKHRFVDVNVCGELPHEVFMSFVNDDDATDFLSWWHLCGANLFGEWLAEKREPEKVCATARAVLEDKP